MKVWTSYFYAVRFMKPWHIPVSTAVSDPAWFHDFKGKQHVFVDKRGVLNGLRSEKLKPGNACEGLCRGRPCNDVPETCGFLEAYRK
jgi:hypothetical protein